MARVGVALALVALIASIIWLLVPRGGIPAVVAPGVQAQLVAKEFNFLEGPVGTEDGGLYFTDLPANKIYRLGPDGLISVARKESGQANGLVVTSDGALLAAEMTDRRISKWSRTGAVTTISDRVGANRYMAPNDLIADAQGGIYFTDPGKFGEPAGTSYVYYLPPGRKEPVVVDDQIKRPNGIVLTPDGKTLMVSDTTSDAVFAYDLQPDGTAKNKRIFANLRDIPAGKDSVADGMAVDRDGRLYVTTRTGVQVFDAKGDYLGTIKVPRMPANVAFSGPDKRTLYITARDGLYRVEMLAQGPDRLGK
jgi:gluconolactonase